MRRRGLRPAQGVPRPPQRRGPARGRPGRGHHPPGVGEGSTSAQQHHKGKETRQHQAGKVQTRIPGQNMGAGRAGSGVTPSWCRLETVARHVRICLLSLQFALFANR